MTFLEVVDDAVKIGIGAFSGWLIARGSRSHAFEKERRRRKQDCLERVVEDLDESDSAAAELRTSVFVLRQANKKQDADYQLAAMKAASENRNRSGNALTKLNRSHSKLVVFGFNDCAGAVQAYHTTMLTLYVNLNSFREGSRSVDEYLEDGSQLILCADKIRNSVTSAFAKL